MASGADSGRRSRRDQMDETRARTVSHRIPSGRNYEPDFVVKTANACLLIEPKRADQMEQDEVVAKAHAAVRWCAYANEHATEIGGKSWHYLLTPDTAIQLGRSLTALQAEFGLID